MQQTVRTQDNSLMCDPYYSSTEIKKNQEAVINIYFYMMLHDYDEVSHCLFVPIFSLNFMIIYFKIIVDVC